MSDNSVISVRDLCVERDTILLQNISWTVKPREHWVVMGPNGCGKTSLFGAITGYLAPTSGTITVLGQEYGRYDWRELRKKIGIVSSALINLMEHGQNALEVVAGGKHAMLTAWQLSNRDLLNAEVLMNRLGLLHLAQRPWMRLSQGEKQQILIARALMSDPAVLLLDEPCTGLDPVARLRFLDFLFGLIHDIDAPSVIMATHHVEEIYSGFSHILLLREGQVVAFGPLEQCLTSLCLSRTFGVEVEILRQNGTGSSIMEMFRLHVKGS
ncbi:MAG: ATP-binding cassette domain-containing protein [Dissulfuribacterales bacterium]